ncbi:MAG: siroheme decarboxylase subunit beta [Alphaproteobacteria bacterium]
MELNGTELNVRDRRLIAALQDGLPLVARPYAALGEAAGMTEAQVIARIEALRAAGTIRRFGAVVRHRSLGYTANAMTVWDIPDAQTAEAGRKLAALPYVTLAYRRPRRAPDWPYNLFCMIHGRDRDVVSGLIEDATAAAGLDGRPRAILFSSRGFKQCGARYAPTPRKGAPGGSAAAC